MIHLKKFNESNDIQEELKDFCEIHLAYLLDDGLEISISNRSNLGFYYITLEYKNKNDKYKYYFPSWDDIKDNIISFFIHLSKSNNYTLLKKGGKEVFIDYLTIDNSNLWDGIQIFNSGSNFKFSLNNIVNDETEVLKKLNGRFRILNIHLIVEIKK